MANLIEWLEKMQADAMARLIEENASLKRELAELRGENAIQTAVYLTESDQLRKTNDKLCRQLKEKEQLLAEITRHVAEAQEQPSKLATRAIGTPKADDIEKVLGMGEIFATIPFGDEERRDIRLALPSVTEQRIRQIVHEELSKVYRLTDS